MAVASLLLINTHLTCAPAYSGLTEGGRDRRTDRRADGGRDGGGEAGRELDVTYRVQQEGI